MKISLETSISFLSLLLALPSLVISYIALRIAKDMLVFTSKDYIPQISYTVNDETDEIEIINKSKRIFNIELVNVLKIREMGYEDTENNVIVQIPFIVHSLMYQWFKKPSKFVVPKDGPGPCAYQICPYDKNLVEKINNRIFTDYGIDKSESGYALPFLQSQFYIVNIIYTNKFQERKSLIYLYKHYHGTGYISHRIDEDDLNDILNRSNIPKISNAEKLWDYLIERYSIPFDEHFGRAKE